MKIFRKKYILPFLLILGCSGYYLRCTDAFSEPLHYYGYYNNVTGLKMGSLVTLNGVSVGKISDISLTPDNQNIRVTIQMQAKDNLLHEGTVAQLVSSGIMGGKDLYLKPGTGSALLPAGATLPTTRDTSLIEDYDAVMSPLITNAKYMLAGFDTSLRGFNKLFFSGLGLTSVQLLITLDSNTKLLAATAAGYNKNSAALAKSIRDFDVSSRNMAEQTAGLDATLQSTAANLKKLKESDIGASSKKMFSSISTLSKNIKGYKDAYDKHSKTDQYHQLNTSLDSVKAQMKTLQENGR